LKKEHSIAGLQKGLSICHKLKGLEQSFTKYHTCASFDVVNDFDMPDYLKLEMGKIKPNQYNLLLSVDILSHIGNLESFLKDVENILRENGFIIALEYTGPAHFQWTEQESS